ncbi:MAG: type II toxin-antitoxin system HicA family toxin [Deltaproteobacteria bacterium]|nr:type II toxin-antitoxin system HicA family toxin [Deltaproteobacteria bacterium]
MKKRDLEKILKTMGWSFLREGGNHEIWTNGVDTEAVPRHSEINENTAKGIIKRAKKRPPQPKGEAR